MCVLVDLMASGSRETEYGRMSIDFAEDRLANLCDRRGGVQTGPFGSQLHQKDYVSKGTPIITVEHLGENRIRHENLPRVSDHDKDRLSKYILRTGDIVFSRVGSVDRRSIVREEENGWLFSGRLLRVRPDPVKIDPLYLSYFFGLETFRAYVRSIAVGATMPSLNTKLLEDVVVYFPSLAEQRRIAHILGTLDDKIELNRRMNETLEEMARAIFKDWFVDFGPVRAKMEGRDAYLPEEIWRLFPDRLVASELGEVPEGWGVRRLDEVVEVAGGTTPSTKVPKYWEGGIHCWATPKDLSQLGSPVLLGTGRRVTDAGLAKIGSGLHPPGTVLLSSRAPIGYLAITEVPVAVNQGFIAMRPRDGVSNLFMLFWCGTFHEEIVNNANGSTFLEINKRNFRRIGAVMPEGAVMEAFDELIRPIYLNIVANVRQSITLTRQRDGLLPGLVSGDPVLLGRME